MDALQNGAVQSIHPGIRDPSSPSQIKCEGIPLLKNTELCITGQNTLLFGFATVAPIRQRRTRWGAAEWAVGGGEPAISH